MKKNKAMRAAGGLFVATMLTTSIISGTYAKYVTSDSGIDNARVAKFGVTVAASGSLFSDTYYSVDDGNTSTAGSKNVITVKSSDNAKVVAPGTKNNDGLTFTVSGTPEVSVKLEFNVTDSVGEVAKDIYLNPGTYPDRTSATKDDSFATTAVYNPVVYTLTNGKDINVTGTITAIKTALEGLNAKYAPNTDLHEEIGDLKLTWEWAFGDPDNNAKDTLLGDLAAGANFTGEKAGAPAAGSYNLSTDVKISISVTQID